MLASNSNYIENKDQQNSNNDNYSRSASKFSVNSHDSSLSSPMNNNNQQLISKNKVCHKKVTQNTHINGVPVTSSI